MAYEIKAAKEERYRAQDYLANAEEAFWTAKESLENGRYTAAVMNSVHAAISANDALCIWISAERCASQKHTDAIELLRRLKRGDAEFEGNAKRLSKILAHKHASEYMGERFSEREARGVVRDTESFLEFVKAKLRRAGT